MPSDYKEWWNERYAELSLEKFGVEYWELDPPQRVEIGDLMDGEASDYMASRIDAAKERRKYGAV